jgi:hypothetical protein
MTRRVVHASVLERCLFSFRTRLLTFKAHAPQSHRALYQSAILIPTLGDLTVALRDSLPELRFTDIGLVHEGRGNVAYESIDAITFKLVPPIRNRLSRAFYGLDTTLAFGSSSLMPKLALHLVGGQTVWLFTGWDFAMPISRVEAIHAAAEFLSERTFVRRFGAYRAQFEAEDRFSYGGYHFHRNGDLIKAGKRLCNVHDGGFSIALGDFHVHVERKEMLIEKLLSWLGQTGRTIDISRDRDCFLSMYRLAYGIFWADEHYRDDVRAPNRRE